MSSMIGGRHTGSIMSFMLSTARRVLSKFEPFVRLCFSNSSLWTMARRITDKSDISAWQRNGMPVPPPAGFKLQIIRKYAEQYDLKTMIETGTFHGDMDFALKDRFSRITTIELSPEFHAAAVRRFAGSPQVECLLGDSAVLLPALLAQIKEPCLFWLDAHYSAGRTAKGNVETPISIELDAVLNHAVRNHVVLIDDARCFDGTHDYPSVADLRESVARLRPDLSFEVEHDIMRITLKTAGGSSSDAVSRSHLPH
jgi:hypothetical protein